MLSPCHSPSIYYACCNQSDLPKTFTWHSITFLCSKFFSHVSSPGRCKSILLNKAFKTFNELITFSTSHANLLLSLSLYIYTLYFSNHQSVVCICAFAHAILFLMPRPEESLSPSSVDRSYLKNIKILLFIQHIAQTPSPLWSIPWWSQRR